MRERLLERARSRPRTLALGVGLLLLVVLGSAFTYDFGLPLVLRLTSDRPGVLLEAKLDPASGRLVDRLGRSHAMPFDLPVAAPLPAALTVEIRLRVAAEQRPYATILSNHCCAHAGFTIHRAPGPASRFVAAIGTGAAWREVAAFDLTPEREAVLVVQVADGRLGLQLDGRPVPVTQTETIRPSPAGLTLGNWSAPGRELAGSVLAVAMYDRPLPSSRP